MGSATNSTALQIGGALGVAVLGSLLNTRYQFDVRRLLGAVVMPSSSDEHGTWITGRRPGCRESDVGGVFGARLAASARESFIDGMVF